MDIRESGLAYLFLRVKYVGNKAVSKHLAKEWDGVIKLCKEHDKK